MLHILALAMFCAFVDVEQHYVMDGHHAEYTARNFVLGHSDTGDTVHWLLSPFAEKNVLFCNLY